MKRAYLFLGILFLFVVTGCSAQDNAQLPDKSEGEQLDQHTWDFGQVEENVILKHEFVFKNESSNVLNIKDVNTSCGCTVSEVKKKTLEPGESTIIGVSFNSKGYSGPVEQYVYVNTDNLDNPVLRYIIKANVVK
jgi:hypothetical protein